MSRAVRPALVAAIAAIAIALAAATASSAPAAPRHPAQRTTLYAVESQVMCVTCGIPLLEAQSAQADDERAYIQTLIDDGDTMAKIKADLVAAYGNEVLALPPASGFDAAVYIVPIAVVLALIALVAVLLPRWRRRRATGPAVAAAAAMSATDAARLDADLARFDR